MRILIDARVISDKMHGIARYAHNLIKNIAELDNRNEYLLLSGNKELMDFSTRFRNIKFIKCNIPLYSLQEQFAIPSILKREKVELYHSPTFTAPVHQPCKTIMTVYDIIHLIFGNSIHKLYYKLIVKKAMMKSACIITVSENSKKDIVNWFNIPHEKIYVIYCGVDKRFKPSQDKSSREELKERYGGIFDRYILFVGNQKPHKNLGAVISAFERAVKIWGFKHCLVIAGIKKGFLNGMNNKIIYVDIDNDGDLIRLYQSADLLLFPSLYEGFGLPALEAMACGCPVVASNVASLPEVCGDAAYYVAPDNIENIAEGMYKVLTDNELRQSLIRKGIERAKLFNWEKSAKEHLKVFEDILNS